MSRFEAMEYLMDTILKLYGASLACVLLIICVMSAYANTSHGDAASAAADAGADSAGVHEMLNSQPLPPRRTPRWRLR
jgi:hypothetical protein